MLLGTSETCVGGFFRQSEFCPQFLVDMLWMRALHLLIASSAIFSFGLQKTLASTTGTVWFQMHPREH